MSWVLCRPRYFAVKRAVPESDQIRSLTKGDL